MDILALNAAAVERREAGYKDWIEQGKVMSEYVQTSKDCYELLTQKNFLFFISKLWQNQTIPMLPGKFINVQTSNQIQYCHENF
jgi:hypothetical protein